MKPSARAFDASGNEIPATITFTAVAADGGSSNPAITPAPRIGMGIIYSREDGWVHATKAGAFALMVSARAPAPASPAAPSNGFPNTTPGGRGRGAGGFTVRVPVIVRTPPITRVAIGGASKRLFISSATRLDVTANDAQGRTWSDAPIRWTTSNAAVATIDSAGEIDALKSGTVTITATSGSAKATNTYSVIQSPVRRIDVKASAIDGRTGDVIRFRPRRSIAAGTRVAMRRSRSVSSSASRTRSLRSSRRPKWISEGASWRRRAVAIPSSRPRLVPSGE